MSSSSTVVLKLFKATLPLFLKVSFPLLIFPVSTWQKHYSLSNLSQAPRAQTSGFSFLVAWNSLYYLFSPPNVYILTFSKTEPQTLPVLAQGIYYTIPEAEEDGQLLGGIVRDQHIRTQWQGNVFFSVAPTSWPPVTGCILTLPREKVTALVEEGKKWARQQSDSQSLYIIQIANIVYF